MAAISTARCDQSTTPIYVKHIKFQKRTWLRTLAIATDGAYWTDAATFCPIVSIPRMVRTPPVARRVNDDNVCCDGVFSTNAQNKCVSELPADTFCRAEKKRASLGHHKLAASDAAGTASMMRKRRPLGLICRPSWRYFGTRYLAFCVGNKKILYSVGYEYVLVVTSYLRTMRYSRPTRTQQDAIVLEEGRRLFQLDEASINRPVMAGNELLIPYENLPTQVRSGGVRRVR
ncbi:hypothetical protein BU24DRAFT_409074 [Aaosphaeria arxii CBS 175.79]|uniref:Uncharacterized protein n=1 Tax=Aaosphaeria arxii CBS 175.79 TaxID=1450172 RepID=A0A6A5XSV8_9PLEO|nr:uncharacterized protein BU24DRAFT_409074 [Aaosphaeria arxii CBS 175.79]KAF2015897.1 hypothetical protein BU24DRAFT_409074 [Aaosphaeria arxii CBS 175.79]